MANRDVSTAEDNTQRKKYRRDPSISLNNSTGVGCNGGRHIMYAEKNTDGPLNGCSFLRDHGGVQVYILTKGNFQDCIIDGHGGKFENGLYKLKGT